MADQSADVSRKFQSSSSAMSGIDLIKLKLGGKLFGQTVFLGITDKIAAENLHLWAQCLALMALNNRLSLYKIST
jgi:hypothetical protein